MASYRARPDPAHQREHPGQGRAEARPSRISGRAPHFLADGPKAVEGALGVPGCVIEVFATVAATEQYAALARRRARLDAGRRPGPGLAVRGGQPAGRGGPLPVHRPAAGPRARPRARLLALCADVRDPGNAGTVIRTADAAGAGAVVLAGHSVDAYNAKTVRATVGSLFHLPLAIEPDPAEAVRRAPGRRAHRAGRGRRR